jgi:energy-converting hydrogenase A subunit M
MEDQVIAMYEDGFTVAEIAEAFNTDLEQVQDILAGYLDDEFDDSMDGDHESAMNSVGWGEDESYGLASEMDLY